MLKCNDGNLAANMSKLSRTMDCRIKSGNDDIENRSRDA